MPARPSRLHDAPPLQSVTRNVRPSRTPRRYMPRRVFTILIRQESRGNATMARTVVAAGTRLNHFGAGPHPKRWAHATAINGAYDGSAGLSREAWWQQGRRALPQARRWQSTFHGSDRRGVSRPNEWSLTNEWLTQQGPGGYGGA